MLFAKALSILFSLFAGLESAKGALYHYVCGGGKDRAFPYLNELKQQFIESGLKAIKETFVWSTGKDLLDECLLDSSKARHWQNDLYFTVGGFSVKSKIIEEGILYEVSDWYDWHSTHSWPVPTLISNKLPKFVIDLMKVNGFVLNEFGELAIKEDLLSSFGQSYWHRGSFVVLWEEIDEHVLYCTVRDKSNDVEETSSILEEYECDETIIIPSYEELDSLLILDEDDII